MYYQRQILPLDDHGHFLLAVHFQRHKVGGECTRESGHACFAHGHVDRLIELAEVTDMFCMRRKASRLEALQSALMANGQRRLARSESSGPGLDYTSNAHQFEYQAMLARQDALFVPRTILASSTGVVAAGTECEKAPMNAKGVLRVVDLSIGKVIGEQREKRWPDAQSLCYPKALAHDGTALVTMDQRTRSARGIGFAEFSVPKFRRGAPIEQAAPLAEFRPMRHGWIAVDETIRVIAQGSGRVLRRFEVPRGAWGWTATTAQHCPLVALAGDKGQISLVDLDSGETSTYFPHRGCKRHEFADVRLSADGVWMASRIRNGSALMVTRLEDGLCWCVAELTDEHIEEYVKQDFTSSSHIPAAFAFIGERLLASDASAQVRELDLHASPVAASFIAEQGKPGARVPLRISARSRFDHLIKKAKLDRVRPQLLEQYSPAVRIRGRKPKKSGWSGPGKRGAPALGTSRLGGWPDLPGNDPWPMWEGRPMSFLAQINLGEVHTVQPNVRLPKDGVLLFFLGCSDEVYTSDEWGRETYMVNLPIGAGPDKTHAWKVIYARADAQLERLAYPKDPPPELWAPCEVRMTRGGLFLPDESTAAYDSIAFEPEERDNYNEVIDLLAEAEAHHQLMGFPSLIQFTPPELECALAAAGKNSSRLPKPESAAWRELLREASEWGLLLQLTSTDQPEFLWGDGGHLYFYGKRSEMASGDFSNVRVIFEN